MDFYKSYAVCCQSYVLIFLWVCSFQRAILSNPINVAEPMLFFLRYSTHFWAVFIVSTTIWSRAPQAVDIAMSNFSSIAPRSPWNMTGHILNINSTLVDLFKYKFFLLEYCLEKIIVVNSEINSMFYYCNMWKNGNWNNQTSHF